MTIAILAMQGAFLEHGQMLDRLGVEHFEIRKNIFVFIPIWIYICVTRFVEAFEKAMFLYLFL